MGERVWGEPRREDALKGSAPNAALSSAGAAARAEARDQGSKPCSASVSKFDAKKSTSENSKTKDDSFELTSRSLPSSVDHSDRAVLPR